MAVEKSGSKTDSVVKLVLIFFVCLLSFSIGTFVGKKFSDNQHKLAKFEPEAQGGQEHGGQDREVASINPETTDVKPGDALTDDEVAKLAEEFVSDDKSEEAEASHHEEAKPVTDKNAHGVQQARTTQSVETKENAPHGAEPMKAAEKVAHDENPTAVAKPAVKKNPIPSSLPKEIANSALGKYTVQIAAYQQEKDAQKMASDLKAKGFSAFYVSAKVKNNTWYRVSVGLFTTQKEAEAYKSDLLTRSKVASAIVQKITE